jgi:hypothetical protein
MSVLNTIFFFKIQLVFFTKIQQAINFSETVHRKFGKKAKAKASRAKKKQKWRKSKRMRLRQI